MKSRAIIQAYCEDGNDNHQKLSNRNGNPLQIYCLENPMDGGAW